MVEADSLLFYLWKNLDHIKSKAFLPALSLFLDTDGYDKTVRVTSEQALTLAVILYKEISFVGDFICRQY